MSEKNFLYVEDDELSREIMIMLLKRMLGYKNVSVFEDSTDFIKRVRALPQPPDIIFLDIHTTPLDGFAMLKAIREQEDYRQIPVIALTASVMSEEVKTLKESGFNGMIAKPLNMDIFPQALQRILNNETVWITK